MASIVMQLEQRLAQIALVEIGTAQMTDSIEKTSWVSNSNDDQTYSLSDQLNQPPPPHFPPALRGTRAVLSPMATWAHVFLGTCLHGHMDI